MTRINGVNVTGVKRQYRVILADIVVSLFTDIRQFIVDFSLYPDEDNDIKSYLLSLKWR